MLKGLTFLPSLAFAALVALPTLAEEPTDVDRVVARVNGEEITVGNLIIAFDTLPEQYQALPKDVLFEGLLNQLIQQTALAQSHGPEVSRRITLTLENERRQQLASDVMAKVLEETVSEADIQAAYDAKYADGTDGMEYNASHILVETEDEAKAIIEELNNGADFAELAKAKSTGPSGPSGGELGWFGTGQMVEEFESAVVAMQAGQISEPVQTQFGWHVISLNEVRPKSAPAFETVRAAISDEVRRSTIEAYIETLTDKADVERLDIEGLDMEVLGDIDALDN